MATNPTGGTAPVTTAANGDQSEKDQESGVFADPIYGHLEYFDLNDHKGFFTQLVEGVLVNFWGQERRDAYFDLAGWSKPETYVTLRQEWGAISRGMPTIPTQEVDPNDLSAPPPIDATNIKPDVSGIYKEADMVIMAEWKRQADAARGTFNSAAANTNAAPGNDASLRLDTAPLPVPV